MASRNGYHWLNKPPLGAQLDTSCELAAGLVGYWLMNEGGGGKVDDQSGNSYAGTMTSGCSWGQDASGFAVSFNGTSGAITATTPAFNFPLTVVALINDSTPATQAAIISNDNGSAFVGWRLTVGRTANVPAIVTNGLAAQTFSTLTLTANVPYFLACTVTASTVVGYLGSLQAGGTLASETQAYSLGTMPPGANRTNIGVLGTSTNFFKGSVSGVLLYSRALSPAEVAALYEERYALILPPNTRRWFVPAAAPAGAAAQLLTCLGCGA